MGDGGVVSTKLNSSTAPAVPHPHSHPSMLPCPTLAPCLSGGHPSFSRHGLPRDLAPTGASQSPPTTWQFRPNWPAPFGHTWSPSSHWGLCGSPELCGRHLVCILAEGHSLGSGIKWTWILILTPPLPRCVTSEKLPNFPEPHLINGATNLCE